MTGSKLKKNYPSQTKGAQKAPDTRNNKGLQYDAELTKQCFHTNTIKTNRSYTNKSSLQIRDQDALETNQNQNNNTIKQRNARHIKGYFSPDPSKNFEMEDNSLGNVRGKEILLALSKSNNGQN